MTDVPLSLAEIDQRLEELRQLRGQEILEKFFRAHSYALVPAPSGQGVRLDASKLSWEERQELREALKAIMPTQPGRPD
jgi:hypothetical protein